MVLPLVPLTLQKLRKLKVVKVCGNTSLLAGGLTRTSYDETTKDAFANVIEILDRLRGTDFAPQLIQVDFQRMQHYTAASGAFTPLLMGDKLWNHLEIKKQCDDILAVMASKKIIRLAKDGKTRSKHISIQNLSRDPKTRKIMLRGLDDPRWKLI